MKGPVFTGVRAVLFDLDGTLIDSAPDLGAAVNAMRVRRRMVSLPLAHYRPHTGSGARGMLRAAFDLAPDHVDYEVYKHEFLLNYEACMMERTRAFLGVEELLSALVTQGFHWGVVTNKAQRFTLPLTRAMPVFNGASTIVSGDSTPHAKPHPAPLLEAARRIGVAPAECVYVGDDERDIVAGRAAGMRTVAATYGYLGPGADASAWSAHAKVDSPLGLLNFFELP